MKFVKISGLIIGLLCLLFVTGCPPKDAIRESASASFRLPGAINDLVASVEEGTTNGVFTPADARKWGNALSPIAKSSVIFVGTVRAANTVFEKIEALKVKPDKTTDETGELARLNTEFASQKISIKTFLDASLVSPFLDVLQLAGLISGSQAQTVLLAVQAVRTILATIGRGFGSSAAGKLPKVDLAMLLNSNVGVQYV